MKTNLEKENMEPDVKNDFLKFSEGNYSELLASIREWEYKPTFFQVIGKEHIEEIMVNTLAFFIDPNNPHSFGNRIYNAFCQAIENSLIANKKNEQYEPLDYGKFNSLRTEITHNITGEEKSGRLDLIINCENCIIGVEAKVRHFVKNPFDIYNDLIDIKKKKSSQENIKKVILCKRGTIVDPIETNGWIVVNWEDILIEEIEEIEDENDVYAPLWEGLKIAFRGEKRMNEEDLKLVAENQEDYLLMYKMIENISKALEEKAKSLKTAVDSELNFTDMNIRIWGTFGQHAEPRVVIEKTKESETEYVVDIVVSAKGYRFLAFDRDNSVQTKINKSLGNEGFKYEQWIDLLVDNKPTERALIVEAPKELMEGLEQSGENKEFFSAKENEDEKIAKIAAKIYSTITTS